MNSYWLAQFSIFSLLRCVSFYFEINLFSLTFALLIYVLCANIFGWCFFINHKPIEMKNFIFILFLVITASFSACKKPKEEILPNVSIEVKDVGQANITLIVTAEGAHTIKLCRDAAYCSEKRNENNGVTFKFNGLSSNEVYSFQAVAFFNQGEQESELLEIRTKPNGLTLPAQAIDLHQANLLAEIFFDQNVEYYFAYGLNGHLNQKTASQQGHGLVSKTITNLQWGSTYFFQVVLKIEGNHFPGEIKSFKTLGKKPEIKNLRVICNDTLSMKLVYDFRGNLLPAEVKLQYHREGQTLEWMNQEFATTDTNWSTQSFTISIEPGYQYFTELRAENSLGLSLIDSTINAPAFMYDGFLYHFVKIGNQDWIVENFRGEHYLNGDPIPYILEDTAWITATTGALCYYEHLKENFNDYGCLYNFYVIEDSRSICPPGWRIPTEDDYYEMITSISSFKTLREIGYDYWLPPNTGANNQTGFSARGAGIRGFYFDQVGYVGEFGLMKQGTMFHVNESFGNLSAAFSLGYLNTGSFGYNDKMRGISIRFVR